jgi:hypothetical protein
MTLLAMIPKTVLKIPKALVTIPEVVKTLSAMILETVSAAIGVDEIQELAPR